MHDTLTSSKRATIGTKSGSTVTVHESTLATLSSLYAGCKAENTKDTYKAQAQAFGRWCSQAGVAFTVGVPVPAEVVALHIAHLRELEAKLSTVRGRVAMLSKWHATQGLPSPTTEPEVVDVVQGYEKSLAKAAQEEGRVDLVEEPSRPLLRAELHKILATIDTSTLEGLRDRALFLLGWCGAFRASELTGLRLEHIAKHAQGWVVTAHATKTGKKYRKEIEREAEPSVCPVQAVEAWLTAANITEGLVFRSVAKGGRVGGSLTRFALDKLMRGETKTVKRNGKAYTYTYAGYAEKAGLGEGKWSWHSLRAGYATQHAIDKDVPESFIRLQGGWSPNSPCFYKYIREAEAFTVRRARVSR